MSDSDYDRSTAFLGEWESFQWRQLLLLSLTIVPNGFSGLAVVFLADTPSHRCLIPAEANLSAAWINSSAAGGCSRYRLSALREFTRAGLEPEDVNVSAVETEPCVDGWEYDSSVYESTIITEWDLVCDDSWKKPLTSSIFFGGVLTGSFISGQLSDRFGRKRVLFVSIAITNIFYFLQIFSPSWLVFCSLYFVVGMAQISCYVTAFVLGMEVLTPGVRSVFSTVGVSMFFAAGYMLLPLVSFLLRSWRSLLLGLTLPCLTLLPLWWLIPESPRWLLSQGRVEEAEVIIKNAAKINKMEAPEIIFKSLQVLSPSEKKKRSFNICDLLRWGALRWLSLTLWLIWNSVTIAYYALSLNTSNLHGDAYLNCFLSALVEVPAYVLSWILFRWCPRRLSLCGTLLTGGGVLLLIPLIPPDLKMVTVSLEMLGKFGATVAFAIIYAYTAELYPTVLRTTALASCSMASRVGSIVAPYFIYLRGVWIALPYLLMGGLTIVTGTLSLLLPETRGLPLPETMDQMQTFRGFCVKKTHRRPGDEEHVCSRKPLSG